MKEGVIQYQLMFTRQPLPTFIELSDLYEARTACYQAQWIGQDPARYEGLGYGNVSKRVEAVTSPNAFVITGSQTGHLPQLIAQDCAWVLTCDPTQNQLTAVGETQPSSEAMTHAVIYQCLPSVNAVIHVHWHALWQRADNLAVLTTPAEIPYGTPAMAQAVQTCLAQHQYPTSGCLIMLGHQDGVLTWGRDFAEAYACLLKFASTAV